ncbi:MAG: hypothetical protein ACFB15_08015 [Cyclobacteriaceae bacterium]
MKNEDRIVELLAESLKKQDVFVEEMKQMRGDISEMRGGIGRVVASVDALTDIVKAWMEKTRKIDDLEERLRKVEEKTSHL